MAYVSLSQDRIAPIFTKLFAGINKQNVIASLSSVKNQDGSRYPSPIEEIWRKPNNRIKQIFLNEHLANLAFGSRSKQNAMGGDHSYFSSSFYRCLYHVADKGIVSTTLG